MKLFCSNGFFDFCVKYYLAIENQTLISVYPNGSKRLFI